MKKLLSAVSGAVLAVLLVSGTVGISADTDDAGTFIYGDIDKDGTVTAADVGILQKYLVNNAGLADPGAADLNKDGKVDVFDVTAMRRLLSGGRPPVTTAVPVTTTTAVPVTTADTAAVSTTSAVNTTTAAVTTVTATTAVPVTATAPAVTTVNEEEKINAYVNRVAELVNEERAEKGIAPVKVNAVMVDAAMLRAKEISELFSHTRPDGTSCFTVFDDFNIKCSYCSENIAAGSASPEDTMNQWINSEGHYNNLMSPKVSEIGIGYCYAPNTRYKYYWVQLFRKP